MFNSNGLSRSNARAGFTLLEIMVSLAIISLVLVSIYRMHAQTISMNYDTRFYATAPFLAQLKLTELENETIENWVDDAGDFGDEYPGYRWVLKIQDVESEPLGELAIHLKKIDVAIVLNHDQLSYDVRTYRWVDN
ncbi:MAG: prepilin-type N-terminal cleavage/methylation domain-containing protein [Desulfobacterales bacterium]|nr:MAG: prepilin-type N-terminal cleavage/methylation domain-containing protein [Desulfobacterales bacterium]